MSSGWRDYVRARLRALDVRAERESEIVEELANQLEAAYDAARAEGRTDAEAMDRAHAEVPDWEALATTLERIESPSRIVTADKAAHRGFRMANLLQDFRYALRSLSRTPGYTTTALTTLMLGFGLATLAIAVLDGILVRPLPYKDAERLMLVKATVPPEGRNTVEITYPDAQDLAALSVFDGAAAIVPTAATTTFTEPPSRVDGFEVSPTLFDVFGLTPALGRLLRAGDESPAAPPVVVLGYGFWQRLGSPPDIVGRTVAFNEIPRTIVGVGPPDFRIELLPMHADVFVPLTTANFAAANRGLRAFRVVVRLEASATRADADAAVAVLGAQLAQTYPETNRGRSFSLWPLHDEVVGPVRSQLWLVASLILLVFLVASVNLAGLLTARAAARVRDVAVRLALGAGWTRLIQQSFAEALLLGVAGAALGAGLAHASLRLLRAAPALSLPRLAEVQIDVRTVTLLAAIVIAVAAGAALLPLLVVRRLHAAGTLRIGHETSSRPAMRVRAALMTGQTAFVFLLLAASILLASSMRSLLSQHLGFDTSDVITMRIAAPPERYATRAATTGFFTELLEAIRQHPTVRGAGLVSNLPLSGSTGSTLTIQGREDVPLALRPTVGWHWTSPGYFAALGMPILSGRDFTPDDVTRTAHVTVINETLARQHFGRENPIGQRVYFGGFGAGGPPEWHEVIGVVGDVRHRAIDAAPDARAYDLFGQHWGRTVSIAVGTREDPAAVATLVRRLVAARDPQLAVFSVKTTADLVDDAVAARRLLMWLVTAFAAAGLVIAAIGLYGTIAYMVTQRTREVGVRVALGATAPEVYLLVFSRGLQLSILGVTLGALLSIAARRIIEDQLFGIDALSVPALAAAGATLLATTLFACVFPARRAVRINPVEALRSE